MVRFYLFGRAQDYSYALPDPHAIVTRRHHLRIWKTDFTMNGTPIWVGAARHDVAIMIGRKGHIINHRIDPDVDAERNFVGSSLAGSLPVSTQEYLHSDKPVFKAQTSSGDSYYSDSRILLVDFHSTKVTNADGIGQPSIAIPVSSLPIAPPSEPLLGNLTSPR